MNVNLKVLEKIVRLRALAQSTNVHEAAAAAERLMQEHDIAEAELGAGSAEDEAPTRPGSGPTRASTGVRI